MPCVKKQFSGIEKPNHLKAASLANLNRHVNLLSPHGRSHKKLCFLDMDKNYTCQKLWRHPDIYENRSWTTPLSQICGPSWEAQQHFGGAEDWLQNPPTCPVADYNIQFNCLGFSGLKTWVTGWCATRHAVWEIRLINQPFWPQRCRVSSKLHRGRIPDIISKSTNMTQTAYF